MGWMSKKATAIRELRKRQQHPHIAAARMDPESDLACPNPSCGEKWHRGRFWPGDWRQCWNRCGEWFRQPAKGSQPVREDANGRRGCCVVARPDNVKPMGMLGA